MIKEVEFGQDARKRMFKGLEKTSKLVTSTMGIGGETVMFTDEYNYTRSTKDGVTVALNIHHLEDPIEELGNLALREASIKTAENAGDGTTTSTLLAYSLVKEGLLALENDTTLSSNEMLKGIESATKLVVDYLETQKLELDMDNSDGLLQKVATLSANGDVTLGKLISTAVSKAGKSGMVTLKRGTGNSSLHRLEEVSGVLYNSGYSSGNFATNQSTGICELRNPYIFLTANPIEGVEAVMAFQQRILAPIIQNGKDLLVVCPKISDTALSNLIVVNNNKDYDSRLCVTSIPYGGIDASKYLEDLAIITGGVAITVHSGLDLNTVQLDDCGTAMKIIVDPRKTVIIDPNGDKTEEGLQAINDRFQFLDSEIQFAKSEIEKKRLTDRKASLACKQTLVHIEGLTLSELSEKFDRADDALKACLCATKEGVVSGGGTALVRASKNINFKDTSIFITEGQLRGASIVEKAIKSPFIKILDNVGIPQEEIFGLMYKIRENDSTWEVFNPISNKLVDALEDGILDPLMVTKVALKNAVSVAGTLLRTGGVIYTKVADEIDESKLLSQY